MELEMMEMLTLKGYIVNYNLVSLTPLPTTAELSKNSWYTEVLTHLIEWDHFEKKNDQDSNNVHL